MRMPRREGVNATPRGLDGQARVENNGRGCDADGERSAPVQPDGASIQFPGVNMTIKVGDRLPAGTLQEFFDVEKDGCAIGPNPVTIEKLTRGKKVVLFGLPGAFTPTCSAKHVPSYLAVYDKLKAKGVDTIACMSVNDAFVMGAWGRDQHAGDKVRMLADGSAEYTKALGLELDLTARGMGIRCQRFSMLVDDGVVKTLNIEAPGKFEVSGGETILTQLG
jgi:peroxiredoxin